MLKRKWVQKGITITNGLQTLTIGDVVNYKARNTDYNGKWRVLGVSKDSELLIVSEKAIGKLQLKGKEAYVKGKEKLDKLCKKYKNGRGAVNARSINKEDIEKLSNNLGFLKDIILTEKEYWLASTYVSKRAGNNSEEGLYGVSLSDISPCPLYSTEGYEYELELNVRAVVTLKLQIKLKKQCNGEWKI